MCIFLTVLYAREVIWPFSAPPTTGTSQAGIQTLAQLHAALVVLSLSQILLHRVRRLLIQGVGVELGLVYANYRLGSPIYCLSDEFLGAARHSFRDGTTLRTVSLTILTMVITLALSPLSAILLTAQPGTSDLGTSHPIIKSLPDGYKMRPSGFVEVQLPVPEENLWPKSLGPSLGVTWSCQFHNSTARSSTALSCSDIPSWFQMEYEDILASTSYKAHQKRAGISSGYHSSLLCMNIRDPDNIHSTVFPSDEKSRPLTESISGDVLRYNYNKDLEDYDSGAVTCGLWVAAAIGTALNKVTLGQMIDNAFEANTTLPTPNGDIFEVSWGNEIQPRQPLVFMQTCQLVLWKENTNQSLVDTFVGWQPPPGYAGCFSQGLYPAFVPRFTEETAEALAKENWEHGIFTFIDMQGSLPYPVSTTTVVGELAFNLGTGQRGYWIKIYAFVGIWAEAEPAFTNESTFNAQEVINSFFRPGALRQPLDAYNSSTVDTEDVVTIDAQWINSLLTYKPFELSNMSTARLLARWDLRLRLPLIIASTMAAAPCSFGICEPLCRRFEGCEEGSILQNFYWNDAVVYNYSRQLSPSEAKLTENQSTLRIKFKASYTAYRFSSSSLVILGFFILYLHVALLLAHFAVIAFGDWWTSNAWTNLGDFLVLAIRSSAAQSAALLAHLSGDDPDSRTWGLVVRMSNTRDEDGARGELEMVLEDSHGLVAAEVPE